MNPSVLVFCTARSGEVSKAVRSAMGGREKYYLVYAGSNDSPFAKVAERFLSWGNGSFNFWKALKLFRESVKVSPETVILPLNNSDGDGYFLLRLFAGLVARSRAIEVSPQGEARTITFRCFSDTYKIEELIHRSLLFLLAGIKPLFKIWLKPSPVLPRYPGIIRCHTFLRDFESQEQPEVSVIIRTYNEERFVGQTLDAVFRQKGLPFEVIVIDSGSVDSTTKIVATYPTRLVKIPKKSFGYGATINLGVQLARGTIVVNLSAHAIPVNENWLKELVSPLADPMIAGTHGAEKPLDGHCSFMERKILEDSFSNQYLEREDDSFFSNANSAMKKQMVLDNPFDESVAWAEDRIWAKTLQEQGFKTAYVPKAAVYHSHNLGARGNFDRCLKFYTMLFKTFHSGNADEVRSSFRDSLAGRAKDFRRFLSDRGYMNLVFAFLHAPFQEYINYLGCEIAWERLRSGSDFSGGMEVMNEMSNSTQEQTMS